VNELLNKNFAYFRKPTIVKSRFSLTVKTGPGIWPFDIDMTEDFWLLAGAVV
jgi:hypothetical protein